MLDLNSNSEEVVYGFVYASLSGPPLPLYIIVMMAVHSKDKREPNMSYKLINLIFFLQAGQTLAHFITSPILIFPELRDFCQIFIRVIGSLLSMFYNAELPSMALLAVCRILVFNHLITAEKMPKPVKLSIFIGLFVLFLIFLYSCVFGSFTFICPGWGFDLNVPLAETIQNGYLIVSIICLATSYISYIIIVYMIFVSKKNSTSLVSRKNELSIMAQYTIIVMFTTGTLIFWYKAGLWFDMGSPKVQATINICWIARAYMDPVLILIFNKGVRNEIAVMMGLRTKKVSVLPLSQLANFHQSKVYN